VARDEVRLVHRIDLPPSGWTPRSKSAAPRRIVCFITGGNDMKRSTNDTGLEGLRIAVTGGTSGLGLALVREWHRRRAAVAFIARGRENVERVAAELSGVAGIVGDVSVKEAIHPIALQVLGRLGGLDVLVNNASSLGPVPLRALADTDCEDLEAALATNLLGPFRLTKALLGALRASAVEARGGVVMNISSDAAVTPYPGWGAYGASKAALAHLSAIWNLELEGEGIRVLARDPGDMDTPLHALAVPGADRSTLLRPEASAREITRAILEAMPASAAAREEAA
jgi:NAD(P)-dependent dehydrogenase (short-subunit alcohol dehydrogenase family)